MRETYSLPVLILIALAIAGFAFRLLWRHVMREPVPAPQELRLKNGLRHERDETGRVRLVDADGTPIVYDYQKAVAGMRRADAVEHRLRKVHDARALDLQPSAPLRRITGGRG
jgi:hypothetical protein